jgi:hypothetical protein
MMTKDFLVHQSFSQCNCLPACSSIVFESEVSVAKLNMTTLDRGHGDERTKFGDFDNNVDDIFQSFLC